MKVVLYMAQTPNGIIARNNGDEDFLSHENWKVFSKLAKQHGCFIVGRKTYDAVKKWKEYSFDDVNAEKIVISKNKKFKCNYVAAYSPRDALKKASKMGFKSIVLTGGGKINSAFMKERLVDEIILNIEPFALGKGVRTFADDSFERKLRLKKVSKLSNGIVQIHYLVR